MDFCGPFLRIYTFSHIYKITYQLACFLQSYYRENKCLLTMNFQIAYCYCWLWTVVYRQTIARGSLHPFFRGF